MIFTGIAIAVMVQRLFELRISKRNAAKLIAQGGRVHHENSLFLVKVLQIVYYGLRYFYSDGFPFNLLSSRGIGDGTSQVLYDHVVRFRSRPNRSILQQRSD